MSLQRSDALSTLVASGVSRGRRRMRRELLQLAGDLARRGEPFVFALVVRREPTSSAQQGDMAIITSDGTYHGWLGGNCTRPSVRREAARALQDGKSRYLSLSPEPDPHPRPQV